MTVRGVASAFAVMALGVLAWPAGGAGADTPYQIAWWNRLQQNPGGLGVGLPAPPNVPDGGLYVASGPDQPSAIAAVRYQLDGAASGTLTLKVANGSAAGMVVNACTITGAWNQGANQTFDGLPTYSCANAVAGTVDTAGTTITWKLGPEFYRSDVAGADVALVPGGTAPVQVAINPPDDSSFTHEAVTPSDSGSLDSSSSSFDSSTAPAGDTSGSFDLGSGDTALSAGTFDAPALAAPTETKAAASGGASQAAAPAQVAAGPLSSHGDKRGQRIAAVAGLLALAGAMWWLAGHENRAPRLLLRMGSGSDDAAEIPAVAAAPVRGIGRFARPRTAPAQRLS